MYAKTDSLRQNSVPIEIEVLEEIPLGTVIGTVQAVDTDQGENAVIEYAIVGKKKN